MVNENGRLNGILVRGAVIAALAGNNDAINDFEHETSTTQDQSIKEVY